MTAQRLVVWAGRGRIVDGLSIDLARDDPRRAAIDMTVESPDRLLFADDAAALDPARSGRIEIRLHTDQTPRLAELLRPHLGQNH